MANEAKIEVSYLIDLYGTTQTHLIMQWALWVVSVGVVLLVTQLPMVRSSRVLKWMVVFSFIAAASLNWFSMNESAQIAQETVKQLRSSEIAYMFEKIDPNDTKVRLTWMLHLILDLAVLLSIMWALLVHKGQKTVIQNYLRSIMRRFKAEHR